MKKILTNIIKNKSVFVFDFDGVIVDSMISKGNSFANIFNAENYLRERIITYHLSNGSVNRIDKIKYISNNIIKSNNSINDKFYLKKNIEFKKNYKININTIKLIKGIYLYFRFLNKNNCKIFIVSAAPIREINYLLKKFKLYSFISKIYDTKISKKQAFAKIIKINNLKKKSYIYFGDSLSDWDLCRYLKIDFCAVLSNKKSHLDKKKSLIKIYDFT